MSRGATKSLTAVIHARVAEAEIRKTTTGKDYLSIKAELLDEAKAAKCGPVWVTSFHKSHIAAGLQPGARIRVDGALDIQRYEKDGEQRVSLRLTADEITIMLEIDERPLSGARAAGEKASDRFSRAMKQSAKTEIASSLSAPHDGTATSASLSDFEPKNKPKLSPAEIAALSMPAQKSGGKRHERPFDDALPF